MKSQVGPPVLDLAPFFENESGHGVCERRSAVVKEMNKAAREWGLFQVINHGVDSSLLNAALQNAKDFFALPWEEKLKHKRDRPLIGFLSDGSTGDESLFFKETEFKASVDRKQLLLFAMEDRPLSVYNAWPESLPNFRPKTTELARQVEKTADLLMTMLSQGLGLSEGALGGAFKTCHHYSLARYPAAMTDDQVVALPNHQDCTCFTMIAHLNQVEGFQTMKDGESEWLTVQAEKDALIVSIADILHVLTNGAFKSAIHRVALNKKERIVLLYFYNPGMEEEIAPLPTEVTGPPRYRPFKYGEMYKLKRAKNITVEHYAL